MAPDEERQRVLSEYRAELLKSRELEAKLKETRLEIRELQKEYERTEDAIKALQSVGQIIGEVLKQLGDERCKSRPHRCPVLIPNLLRLTDSRLHRSHCQSLLRPALCCWLPIKARQGQAQAGHPCGTRHDDTDYHAHAAPRGRSPCLQHVSRGPRPSQLCRDWWSQ